MAENIDWKKLGLGVKDLLVGVVTVAGGATGGGRRDGPQEERNAKSASCTSFGGGSV